MRAFISLTVLLLAAEASARPIVASRGILIREVPQEHSHEQFLTTVRVSLNLNNPAGIVDPVFGLLGNAAASQGLGSITDPDCLQQATADQAFTNAKAAGDVNGQVAALIYRTLERNTGSVGLQSNSCTTIKATNPEIATLSQHQDPASTGAAATNKAIALALAVQIAGVGGDPNDAIKSGTFAPGQIGDPTARGNSCDDQNDPVGCIFTQNLLVPDVTADEIASAVSGSTAPGSSGNAAAAISTPTGTSPNAVESGAGTACAAAVTVTVNAAPSSAVLASTNPDTTTADLQTFTGDLGATADPITFSGDNTRPFLVNGNTFVNFAAAAQRTCDIQFNACADQANSGANFSVADCQTQEDQCDAAQTSAPVQSFSSTTTATPSIAATTTIGTSQTTATNATSTTTSSALDFGTCTNANPDIQFGPGFDGRTENSFEPVDMTNFNHGSALNIGVITSFICQQLQDKCKASAATLTACAKGQQAAAAATGQAAADAFNAAFT